MTSHHMIVEFTLKHNNSKNYERFRFKRSLNHSWRVSIKEGMCLKVKWGRDPAAATLMSAVF